MLHPRDTLHHCAVFLEGGYIEAHRFLIEFTLVFDKPPSIQQRLKRRSKWFVAVVGFMILAFTTKEELCTRLWMHRRLLVYDPQRLSRNVIYCSTPHPFDSSPHLVAIGFGAGKNNTSSDASREVPERTYNETARTGSVLFVASLCRVGFSGLSRDAPRRGGWRLRIVATLPHTREIYHPASIETLEFRSDLFSNVWNPGRALVAV